MSRQDVIIYHNEPDDKVYVKVQPGIDTYFQLQNLAGKVLQEAVHQSSMHDFDLTDLPEGIYFVLINQDERIYSKKIYVER